MASPLLASTLTVSNTNDAGPGSLRQAIQEAAPDDTIQFGVTGIITLTNGQLLITNNLTIVGPGATNLALSGNYATRLFEIGSNVIASISGVAIINGYASGADGTNNPSGPGGDGLAAGGGGIRNAGSLSLSDCILTGNGASGGDAGAGFPTGNAAIGFGGGIWNTGSLLLKDCTVSANSANGGSFSFFYSGSAYSFTGGNAKGGALFNEGMLILTNCRVAGNSARGGDGNYGGAGAEGTGGGVANTGAFTAIDCTFMANSVRGGFGGQGGGYFIPNVSGGSGGSAAGGGIHTHGTFVLRNCTLNANSATGGDGGGAGARAGFGGPGQTGSGGAICSVGPGSLTNCTLSGNGARGGGGGYGFAGRPGGAGANAYGGGIAVDGALWIVACTLTTNSVFGGDAGPNSPTPPPRGYGIGGGISASGDSIHLYNTIVADNALSAQDLNGNFASEGHNLVGKILGATGFISSDLTNVSARLGPLQNNGGLTFTHALLSGSPAVDTGNSVGVPRVDQRGLARPIDDPAIANGAGGDGSDIGAFELQSQPITLTGPVKAGGNVLVSFFTEVGQTYRIEGKEALESGPWTTVADNVAGTGARVQVMDPDGAGRPARFYRGRTLP